MAWRIIYSRVGCVRHVNHLNKWVMGKQRILWGCNQTSWLPLLSSPLTLLLHPHLSIFATTTIYYSSLLLKETRERERERTRRSSLEEIASDYATDSLIFYALVCVDIIIFLLLHKASMRDRERVTAFWATPHNMFVATKQTPPNK